MLTLEGYGVEFLPPLPEKEEPAVPVVAVTPRIERPVTPIVQPVKAAVVVAPEGWLDYLEKYKIHIGIGLATAIVAAIVLKRIF